MGGTRVCQMRDGLPRAAMAPSSLSFSWPAGCRPRLKPKGNGRSNIPSLPSSSSHNTAVATLPMLRFVSGRNPLFWNPRQSCPGFRLNRQWAVKATPNRPRRKEAVGRLSAASRKGPSDAPTSRILWPTSCQDGTCAASFQLRQREGGSKSMEAPPDRGSNPAR